MLAMASFTEQSSTWPPPGPSGSFSRCQRAASVAKANVTPAPSSAKQAGGVSGSFSGVPALNAMVPVAVSTLSVASRPDHGPVSP